jgi:uncharacterized membrane protein
MIRLLLPLALAGCVAPGPPTDVSPPASRLALNLPTRLVGLEPSWTVLIKDGSLSFTGADRGAVVAAIGARNGRRGGVIFRTAPPNVHFPVAVQATLGPGPCRDRRLAPTLPYSATVAIDYAGASPPALLRGCAGPEGAAEPFT